MTFYQIISKLAHILGTAITCSAFWYAGGPNHHMLVYGGLGWFFFTLSERNSDHVCENRYEMVSEVRV